MSQSKTADFKPIESELEVFEKFEASKIAKSLGSLSITTSKKSKTKTQSELADILSKSRKRNKQEFESCHEPEEVRALADTL